MPEVIPSLANRKKPLVCGHRGASGHAPENTLAAFREAVEAGAAWIEFDVQLSSDGEVIILHDDTLKRTTNLGQDRPPMDFTLAELRQLDAGKWFGPGFAGELIPTLDEVLEEFRGKLGLNIEIKSKTGANLEDGIEARIAEKLARHNLYNIEQVIVSSFDMNRLIRLHALEPKIPLGVLFYPDAYPKGFDPLPLIPLTGARAFHPVFKMITESLVERTHQQGVLLNTWTVNEASDMRRMVELGVDMIITNYPAQLQELLEAEAS